MRLATALLVVALCACVVPTLEELEAERPRACDAEHACVDGYLCVGGTCVPSGSVECVPESCNGKDDDCDGTADEEVAGGAACALTVGVCAGSTAGCVEGAFEAACSTERYGADYEPTESRCDGKDNDCDGETDESLIGACELQAGVCAGAEVVCSGGVFPACSTELYLAHDDRYQAVEVSCDGADNDCDGLADAWSPLTVSAPVERASRAAAAARSDGTAVVLFEQGSQLRARPVGADGVLGPAVAPTGALVLRAFSPALASNGAELFGAWIEEFDPGAYRVMLAPLGADGQSSLEASGARSAVPVYSGTAVASVTLAASATRLLVLIEESGAQGRLRAIGRPAALPPASGVSIFDLSLTAAGEVARRPAVRWSAGSFQVAWESNAGIELRSLRDDTGAVAPRAGLAVAGARFPQLAAGSSANDYSLYVVRSDATAIDEYLCADTNNGTCSLSRAIVSGHSAVENLRVSDGLAVWNEGTSAVDVMVAELGAASPVPLQVDPPESTGLRPVPVRQEGTVAVLYDSEGGGDQVLLQRLCAP